MTFTWETFVSWLQNGVTAMLGDDSKQAGGLSSNMSFCLFVHFRAAHHCHGRIP